VPELPEVETVRDGLARFVVGWSIAAVEVRHPRAIRRHDAGAADFDARLLGCRIDAASRRGKYLWLRLSSGQALVVHLGMSGQLLVQPPSAPDERHLHVRLSLQAAPAARPAGSGGRELRFIDQRTFGGMLVDDLVATTDHPDHAAQWLPSRIAHIARDPLDPLFEDALFVTRLRARDSEIKRALLDQSLVSGVGNIYADESLWRAQLSGRRIAKTLSRPTVLRLLAHLRAVLSEALVVGGTSFDALYVNVNGQSGYFDRSLSVYGRAGRPCPRCGTAIVRAPFMNRSSYSCPHCQPAPRRRAALGHPDTRPANIDALLP
jgi:formamidopyrimidine-DNA glycosylase